MPHQKNMAQYHTEEYGTTIPCKGALREDFPFAINTKDVLQDICSSDFEDLNLACVLVLAHVSNMIIGQKVEPF